MALMENLDPDTFTVVPGTLQQNQPNDLMVRRFS